MPDAVLVCELDERPNALRPREARGRDDRERVRRFGSGVDRTFDELKQSCSARLLCFEQPSSKSRLQRRA